MEIVKGLKKKQFSYKELVKEVSQKVAKLNPELNAFVTFETDQPIKDEAPVLKDEQPLSGLPFPLKMLGQEKQGWLATSGSKLFQTHRSSRNSNFVSQVEKIGLIPLGQTNAPEFGFKNITDHNFMVQLKILGILRIRQVVQVVGQQPLLLLAFYRSLVLVTVEDQFAYLLPFVV